MKIVITKIKNGQVHARKKEMKMSVNTENVGWKTWLKTENENENVKKGKQSWIYTTHIHDAQKEKYIQKKCMSIFSYFYVKEPVKDVYAEIHN